MPDGARLKLKDLVMSSPDSPSPASGNAAAELAQLRASVDSIDCALVQILGVRFNITRQVSELKAKHSLPASDPEREAKHLDELRTLAAARGLEASVLDPVFSLIYGRVVRSHQDVAAWHRIHDEKDLPRPHDYERETKNHEDAPERFRHTSSRPGAAARRS